MQAGCGPTSDHGDNLHPVEVAGSDRSVGLTGASPC